MADVTGPISSMPGSTHAVPSGMLCDNEHPHPVLATIRVQGETDSMGSEMEDLCQECYDKMLEEEKVYEEEPCECAWCKVVSTTCRLTRDYDEGSCGPLYNVCSPCRQRENARLQAELDEDDDGDDNHLDAD